MSRHLTSQEESSFTPSSDVSVFSRLPPEAKTRVSITGGPWTVCRSGTLLLRCATRGVDTSMVMGEWNGRGKSRVRVELIVPLRRVPRVVVDVGTGGRELRNLK